MPLRTQVDDAPNVNMTSMIDIVFLLIIFFMVGTRFAEIERKITLQVPQVSDKTGLPPAPDRHTVNVYRDGGIMFDGHAVTLDELTEQLAAARQQQADFAVIVRGDGAGEFGRVADVLNACKQAGVAELAISVKIETRRK